MNLQQLRATLMRNRTPLAVGGAGVVALLALRARSRRATPAQPADATGVTYPGTAGYSAGYQAAAATGYDSTAADVVGAVQPYLERLQRAYEQQQADTPPTPVPADPTVQGWFRKTGTERVYAAMSDGTLKTIDRADWIAAGRPGFEDLPGTDPVWSRPAYGAAAS